MAAGDLAREKLARLQEAWVLETDAARKFKLAKEIEEAKAQVREFGGKIEDTEATGGAAGITANHNQITGNNNKIQIIIHYWSGWVIGGLGVLLIFGLWFFSDKSQISTGDCNAVVSGSQNVTISSNCAPK